MTKEELAAILNGREYGKVITKEKEALAKTAGLVVVFGYGDYNIELHGACDEVVVVYGSGTLCVTSSGEHMPKWPECDEISIDDARKYFRLETLPAAVIKCEWSPDREFGVSWRITTSTPHAKFDVVEVEGDEIFCRGIVFALADIGKGVQA